MLKKRTAIYYYNLTPDFSPYMNTELGMKGKMDTFFFKGGEPHVKLGNSVTDKVVVTARLGMKEFITLPLLVDALRRKGVKDIEFVTGYFPGGRQDRVAVPGEGLTVKVYADHINNLGFSKVTIFDPHSDVTPALINNVEVKDNTKFVRKSLGHIFDTNKDMGVANTKLVSPDAGANKKIVKLCTDIGMDYIKCDKKRNVKTGELSGFEVYSNNLYGANCVIVDDICDGGGTFMGTASELLKKGAGKIFLVISHGIFSKAFTELLKHFKGIYTTDSLDPLTYFEGVVPKRLTVIKLNQVI